MADSKLKRDLKQWADNKRRPLVLVAVGRGGAGKSTLVNNLLELEEGDEQYCSVGNLACAKTKDVEVRRKQKEGVEIHIADTPGLGASVDKIDPGKVIKDISKKTEKKADILSVSIPALDHAVQMSRLSSCSLQLMVLKFGSVHSSY